MTIEVKVRAGASASVVDEQGKTTLRLDLDDNRKDARISAKLTRPSVARDALAVLARVFQSDLRFKATDRSDYLAFLLKQGKKATKELWEAQKAFLDEKFGEATQEHSPLDPLVTVSDDALLFEVLSADESAYARLTFKAGEAYETVDKTNGTSHLRVTDEIVDAISRVRGHRETTLELGPSGEGGEERTLAVPERWLRAFSQVQAASTLPAHGFALAPVDFYNLLFTLRMRRAKKSPRALRYELVPGDAARMVLEPWDLVLESVGPDYDGPAPRVVRTWGRRRLSVLSPLLPHIEHVRVYPMGAGLPVIYELDLGDCVFTLALSGWTDRGWAGISAFDLLVPTDLDPSLGQAAVAALEKGPATLAELAGTTGKPANDLRKALLVEIQRGVVLHERTTDRYRHRPLLDAPVDLERLRYRDAIEEEAHRLLAVADQVRILKTHDLGAEGFRIEGEVEDKHARRVYKTSFTIDREGRTVDASCTSRQFRRSGLKEGPSAPMIALRLLYSRTQKELEAARETEEGRKLIRAETRTLLRRDQKSSIIARVSFDDRQVIVRWGRFDETPRMQRMLFGTQQGARDEYFRRLGDYAERGFIDATAAEAVA